MYSNVYRPVMFSQTLPLSDLWLSPFWSCLSPESWSTCVRSGGKTPALHKTRQVGCPYNLTLWAASSLSWVLAWLLGWLSPSWNSCVNQEAMRINRRYVQFHYACECFFYNWMYFISPYALVQCSSLFHYPVTAVKHSNNNIGNNICMVFFCPIYG